MSNGNQLNDRVGEVSYTKYGTKATIIQYLNNKKVLIEFDDDYKYRYYTSYINFIQKKLTNPYDRNVYGIGFIGSGNYDSKHISYPIWFNMIKRCYKTQRNYDDKSYENCMVDIEWHNFQNFAQWYEENVYDSEEKLVIDKDIKIHNNRLYSKENCILIPETINLLFIKEKSKRGDLPIGVYFHEQRGNYVAMCSVNGKTKYIGSYVNPVIAFEHYKQFKEDHIRDILQKYIGTLSDDIYTIVSNYKIEITD